MIEELQAAMLEMPQAECKTVHTFCSGVYAREMFIPKGVCLVGAKHKTEFFITISKGRCVIKDGDREQIFSAPYTGISKVGAKRAILAIEDTIITGFHPTDKTDITEIQRDIIEDEGLKIANNHGSKLVCG